jgi:hypothetical protein
MGVDQTETSEPQDPGSVTGEFGKGQPFLISDDDGLNASSTADENPYLAPDLIGQFG